MIKDPNCMICNRETTQEGGKDILLWEGPTCNILLNGSTELVLNGKVWVYSQRYTLATEEHVAGLPPYMENVFKDVLRAFVEEYFPRDGYFIKRTMNTVPNHYHVHAFVYPLIGIRDAGC